MKKELIHTLIAKNINLKIVDGNLKINAPKGTLTPELISEIKSHKEYLLKLLSANVKIPKAQIQKDYPVTSAQERLWILSHFEGGNTAYNISNQLEFNGPLDREMLSNTFNILVERHESLRTCFKENEEGELRQYILNYNQVDFNVYFKNMSTSSIEEVDTFIKKQVDFTFDLKEASLLKVDILKISSLKHLIVFNLHHIIGDGWSLEVLAKELILIYNALINNKKVELKAPTLQYRDYAVWLTAKEQQKKLVLSKNYWLKKLAGELPILSLPTSKKRPPTKTFNGQTIDHHFSKTFYSSLKKVIKEEEASLFMGLMASINALLFRYTEKTDLIVGTAVAGREHPDLAEQIGLFLNTLAIRTQFNPDTTFKELLAVQKSTLLDAYKHQSYPFSTLIEDLNPERNPSRSPLFDIMVILQNQHDALNEDGTLLKGIEVKPYVSEKKTRSQFDLSFSFIELNDGLQLSLEYNTDIFHVDFIQRLFKHLELLVIEAAKKSELPIAILDYLSKEEKNELLIAYTDTAVKYDPQNTFVDRFKAQIKESGNNTALIFGKEELSYNQLNERSDQLAGYLISQGLQKNKIIALCLDRSIEMIIGIIGILKAGATYLPLDPTYPIERLEYIIKDSGASLILTKKEIRDFIPSNINTIYFEEEHLWKVSKRKFPKVLSGSSAYMIYTSGTTGKPKGVVVSHRNLFNFFLGLDRQFKTSKKNEVWLAVTSISFDISILELLWTLTRGSKVVVLPDRPLAVAETKEVKFSFLYFATQEEIKEENKYNLLLKGAEFADQNGFKAVWIPERHFHSFGDQFPNPSVAAAAVAVLTKNISIRSGSVVLPLHDPVRVAEEWSMVDNLSEGRVELSIASGWHPNDFVLAPTDYEDRHQIMRSKIETLKNIWSGGSLTRINGSGQDFAFKIHPRPIQKNLKVWITASRSEETFRYAGSIGANVLTRLLGQSMDALKENIEIYRGALKEHGFNPEDGKVAVMLHTFISDKDSFVKETVEAPFKNYLRNSASLMKPIATAVNLDLTKDFEAIVEIVFQRFYNTSCLFGTPESCLDKVKELYKIGVNEIASLLDFGVATNVVMDNLKYLKTLKELVQRDNLRTKFFRKRLNYQMSTTDLIRNHKVNHLQATPSFIKELQSTDEGKEALAQIDLLLIGGEALPESLGHSLLDLRRKPIYNMYGPTETTIWSSIKKITKKEPVTIGKPIANTQMYILDKRRQICPKGVIGELWIGGDGVSSGYHNLKEITKQRFIKNIFKKDKTNQFIYRTGDLARWLPNGELECLGRLDDQIKLRGYRIELGEIENRLRLIKGISDAVVDLEINDLGEKELRAFVISKNTADISFIRASLGAFLPSHMIPSKFLIVKKFPMTPNGKIDRTSLSKIEGKVLSAGAKYKAPEGELEERLVEIWKDVLRIDRIGVSDNFFEIGGSSLKIVKVLNNIKSKFGVDLKIELFFKQPTIEFLALHIENHTAVQHLDGAIENKKIVI